MINRKAVFAWLFPLIFGCKRSQAVASYIHNMHSSAILGEYLGIPCSKRSKGKCECHQGAHAFSDFYKTLKDLMLSKIRPFYIHRNFKRIYIRGMIDEQIRT